MAHSPWEEMERRRGELTRHAENLARLASAYAEFFTTGTGHFAFPTRVTFEVAFVERPFMTYGAVCLAAGEVEDFPRCTGFVWDWTRNAKGMWTGAHCAVCVDNAPGLVTTPEFRVSHHFAFAGIGMKDLPAHLLDD